MKFIKLIEKNIFGVRIFGEGEFWLSSFKVLLVFAMILFTRKSPGHFDHTITDVAVITMSGGNPQRDAYGFRNWNVGPFAEYVGTGAAGHFAGFFSVFVQAAFAFGGPDMIAIAAGEIQYPRRVIPSVYTRVIYRLIFFFVGGSLCVGILVSFVYVDLAQSERFLPTTLFLAHPKRALDLLRS